MVSLYSNYRAMRIFILLLFVTLLSSCYSDNTNCKDFKTGKFVWEQDSDGKLLRTTFERNDSLQIETFENKIDSARVEWINECEWRLIPINPKKNADSRAYLFKIMNTTKDSYTFEFMQSGRDQVYRGTAQKIN